MDLRRLNLNLLLILNVLLETRQVTAAARRLGITQPATSMALAKLRYVFDDELLVSVGRDFQLTPKAEALREPVQHLVNSLETIFKDEKFSPSSLHDEFIIATADYMSIVVLPHLITAFAESAPDLTLRFTNLNRNSPANLKAGEIDMILAPVGLIKDPDLISRHIFDDRLVVAYRCESTDQKRKIDLQEYLAARHITTVIDTVEPVTWYNVFVKEIDDLRARQRNVAIVPYYAALPLIAANSSLLALVQERLVSKFTEYLPIAYTDPPVELPTLQHAMFWSPRVNREPRHQWIRDTISSVCQRAFPRGDDTQ